MTRIATAALLSLAAVTLAACGPRVEYRVRPGFATKQDIPDEVVLEDGTVIRYLELNEYLAMQAKEKGARPSRPEPAAGAAPEQGSAPWEEYDDGTVRMQAERNDQVIALTMRAFREERYGELWDQLVSRGVRERASADVGSDKAREQFVEWCAKWRSEVMTLLNRMSFAFSSNSVIIDRLGPGLIRLRLAPQITGDFKYRSIEVYTEQSPKGDRAYLGGIK